VPFLFAVRISYIFGDVPLSFVANLAFQCMFKRFRFTDAGNGCVLCRFKSAPTHASFHTCFPTINGNACPGCSSYGVTNCSRPFACGAGGTASQAERGPFTTYGVARTWRAVVRAHCSCHRSPLGERVNSAPVRASFISLLPTETPLHSQVNAGRSRCTSIKLFYSHYDAIIIINRISF
jgi:hypothetical protein